MKGVSVLRRRKKLKEVNNMVDFLVREIEKQWQGLAHHPTLSQEGQENVLANIKRMEREIVRLKKKQEKIKGL